MYNQQLFKAHCNGNDFVIIYKDSLDIDLTSPLIQKLCNREHGIGSDGLLLISDVENYDFKMDYYNNDGSWETMCANGALCVIKLLQSKNFIFQKNLFLAGDGNHKIKFHKFLK